jgi:hypothetical protein
VLLSNSQGRKTLLLLILKLLQCRVDEKEKLIGFIGTVEYDSILHF